jgi:hypothetical protein
MLMLEHTLKEGQVEGIHIGAGKNLLHQLFADDMGLFLKTSQQNFRKVKEIIDTYERISGAQVNLSKSLILPLLAGPTPAWFGEIGCQIGQPGQVFKYLGSPIGINLSTDAELKFLLDKVRKKLRHWSHKMLSMTGRMVYIKHILRSVPVYNLMGLDYTQAGLQALESISRKFFRTWRREAPSGGLGTSYQA